MKLVSLKITNFKRFAGLHKLVLDGKVVGIFGPNEAGKTSVLRALEHLNHTGSFATSGSEQETTRGTNIEDDDEVICATYWVTEDDRTALKKIPEAADVRWVEISKPAKGKTFYVKQIPDPERDLSKRQAASEFVSQLKTLPDGWDKVEEGELESELPIDQLKEILSSNEQDLTGEQIKHIRSFKAAATTLLSEDKLELLDSLAESESLDHPSTKSRKILYNRQPKYLLFDDESRQLESQYSLYRFFNEAPEEIPASLKHLLAAANIDLEALYYAAVANDHGEVESIIDAANAKLEELVSANWSQSEVSARLRLDNSTLHILAGARGKKFVQISERSDGLRLYLALLAFLSQNKDGDVLPILLIDEAETHLHYDAQADLIQMLAKQQVAEKVIYTTHSIGCLSEDLGLGVRMVETDGEHSKFNNWFWESSTPGFSPVLFGIGATTLAFIPIRHALITEGATDILLLPAMFREALGVNNLGFQIAPGLSQANKDQIAIVDAESPRTAYLTDGDKAGVSLKREIKSAGVAEDRIFALPQIAGTDSTIEDFVNSRSLLRAVNLELERSHGKKHQMDSSDLRRPGAVNSIDSWCETRKIRAPQKRAIAYHLLENRHENPIVALESRQELIDLYQRIVTVFGSA